MHNAHLTSSLPVTAAHLVKDDGVRPADLVPSPCPWKGCRLVYVTGTGLAACTFCSSLFSWAAAGESGGSSCLRSSRDFRSRSNFRLDSARLACACKGRILISGALRIHMCEASAKETERPFILILPHGLNLAVTCHTCQYVTAFLHRFYGTDFTVAPNYTLPCNAYMTRYILNKSYSLHDSKMLCTNYQEISFSPSDQCAQ
jgi:hypothetical protein